MRLRLAAAICGVLAFGASAAGQPAPAGYLTSVPDPATILRPAPKEGDPRDLEDKRLSEAARQLQMEVVPEGGSLFNMNMSMIADGHTTIEHSLPVQHIYDAGRFLSQIEIPSPDGDYFALKVMAHGDVRDKLPSITAPTLLLHRTDATFVPVAHGRYLAEHIAGARYVELPGEDTLYWVGDSSPVLDEIEEFITGVRAGADSERVLTTIVFTDIVSSTQRAAALGDIRWHSLLDNHDTTIRHELERFGGTEVNTVGDGFVAIFTSPSGAINCAEAIVDAVLPLGIEVRVGIHAGEVELRGNDIAGMAVHIGARVSALAGPSEVLVSSTVREIVTGSRHGFTDRGEYELKGVPGRWRVCELVRAAAVVAQ